jgi:hypothetical protein
MESSLWRLIVTRHGFNDPQCGEIKLGDIGAMKRVIF